MDFDEIKGTFVLESSELLDKMEEALLRLESAPHDTEAINALFRSAHTIKGSAGIVDFKRVEGFTHVAENVLDKVRDGAITISGDLIGLLLKCRDHIKTIIALSSESDDTELKGVLVDEEGSLLTALRSFLGATLSQDAPEQAPVEAIAEDRAPSGRQVSTENWHISLRFGPDILKHGLDPMSFISYLGRLGTIVSLATLYDAIPPASEYDAEACYLGIEMDFKSDFDKKTIEDVFEFIREDSKIRIIPPKSEIDEYINFINDMTEDSFRLGDILLKGGALTENELKEALRLQTEKGREAGAEKLGDILVKEALVDKKVIDAALDKQKSVRAQGAREAKTIRVDADKLDSLINLVGELVIAGGSISQHAQRVADSELIEASYVLGRLLEDIRDRAMTVRMVPIGDTFSRFQRVLRDISKSIGNDIALVIKGGETELDKTVVEKIVDPLTHLVRNSADHGIEAGPERARKGKPATGTITLNAFHDAGSIVIEVSDDGKGLDKERIVKKAIEKGLIKGGQNLSDSEVYSLIFEPGFSTAENITKLSGRGVGMDVVRRNIEELRGAVHIKSETDKGTVVSIRLPLTLAIIDGFLVKVGPSFYVIPLDMVVECVELPSSERGSVVGRSYINLRGAVLPYIRLKEVFSEEAAEVKYENIVVVQYAGQKVGFVVDELFGEVQAVIRSLGRLYRGIVGVSGATILGDGKVALIVDVPKLIGSVELAGA
ncbi:MAG: chemotaxis protein CheA [Deltaproteobacteria bacterium]